MTVAVAVQAHPVRAARAASLATRLNGRVVFDPDPDAARPCAWRSYRAALESDWGDATHLLVVQDDAEPCDHLLEVLPVIAAARPTGLMCLYVGGQPRYSAMAMESACHRGLRYTHLSRRGWTATVATMWPLHTARDALEFVDQQRWRDQILADDEIVGRAVRALNIDVRATVPSLVEHPDDVASLTGNKRAGFGANPNRCAHILIPEGCDVRSYDWATHEDHDPMAPNRPNGTRVSRPRSITRA